MPVVCHGRKANHPKNPAVEPVQTDEEERWFTHTLQTPRKESHRVDLREAHPVHDRHDGRSGHLVYTYWGITPKRPDWVKTTYRKRFGSRPATGT